MATGENSDRVETQPPDPDVEVRTTDAGVEYVRTPDDRFEDVEFPGIDYEPRYVEIDGLRVHYVEAGPSDGQPILLLHGEPSWAYLYREVLPMLAAADYRPIAMDFVGAGRSDKPIDVDYYSYVDMSNQILTFVEKLDLDDVTLVGHDWGAYTGLRTVGLHPERFARVVLTNGQLPLVPEGELPYDPVENPDDPDPTLEPFYADWPAQQEPFRDAAGNLLVDLDFHEVFDEWMAYSMKSPDFRPSEMVEGLTWYPLTDEARAAYDAPYPSRTYMALPRYWPSMMLEVEGLNRDAWAGLKQFDRPFVTIHGHNDAGILGDPETYRKYHENVPGAAGQPHSSIRRASHFLQEDQGVELARRVIDFVRANPLDSTRTASPGEGTPRTEDES